MSGTVEVKAEVSTSARLAYVLLGVDGTRPAATNSLPATFQLDTQELSDGPHVVFAEAYSSRDMIAASKAITIYVSNQAASQVADAVPSPRMPMVVVDGRPLAADVAPTLVRGQMHTGFRALFTATGARIDWLAEQRVARCVTDSLVVEVPIGSRIATVNGRHVDMGAVATIKNDRTIVPLRFFAQVTGSRVSWDARIQVASVQTPSRAMASAQASLTPAASMQTTVSDRVSTRTPIYEVADLGP